MIEGFGVDIVEVKRIKAAVKKFGAHFLNRIFTPREVAYCKMKGAPEQHLAARFAAKEAVYKAFGGDGKNPIAWTDVEIINDKHGKPLVVLKGTAKKKADTATIFDLKTLKTLKQVKTGNEPDAVVYDPVSRRVFVFNRKSNDATVFEADSGKAVGTVGLGGQTECAVADGKGRVFINNMDISALAVIDSKTLAIVNRYSLYPGNKPAGLAYDPEHARLFAACFSRSMVVVDAEGDGRYLDSFPIGTQAQSAVFDPATQTAFSSNAGGTVTVARETSPGKFEVIQTIATQPGAGTMALDPGSHRLYVPVKDKNGFAVLVIGK